MTNQNPPISNTLKWLITITAMLAAIIEIIDSTIVNVALKDMGGSLGASNEQITWVVTSYIVSAAILMPLTGFLVRSLGRKRLLLINIIGFLIFSVLCGASNSLGELVFFRIMQGVFGASLVPLSQYILRDTFPPKEHVKAMAIWGVGIMAAPALGPTLGGYITDWASWRWIFYINVPVCLIAITMASMFISETPRIKQNIDWIGLILMVITIITLQLFLDRGNSEGWLSSHFILAMLLSWVILGITFIVRGWSHPKNILNLRLFKDRNYASCCTLLVLYTSSIFGVMTIQPLIMQGMMGYSAAASGELMMPRGIAAAIAMMMIMPLSKKVGLKSLICAGLIITAYGNYLYTLVPLTTDSWHLLYPGIIQGIGMGFFFVPVSTMAFETLSPQDASEGSGMFSFFRNLGTSLGTSTMITILTQQTQVAWHSMVKNINPMNPNYYTWLERFNWQTHDPVALATAARTIQAQSTIMGFHDTAVLSYLLILSSIPIVFLLKKSQH